MRKSFGSLLMGIAIIVAWFATFIYVAFLSISTPSNLANASVKILKTASVQSALADSLTNFLSAQAGSTVVAASTIKGIIKNAADSPTVQADFVTAMRTAEGHLQGTSNAPIVLTGAAFTQVVASGLSVPDPALAASVAKQQIVLKIPGAGITSFGKFIRSLERSWLKFLIAVSGTIAVLAAIISSDHAGVIKRIGHWLLGISIIDIVIFVVLPYLILPRIAWSWAPIIAIALQALGTATVTFFIELFAVGLLIVFLGTVIKKL